MPGIIISGPGGLRSALALETKRRNHIPNEMAPKRSPSAMFAAMRYVSGQTPGVVCRSLDSVYNCMGMVFGSRRTAIDLPHFGMITADDGLKLVTTQADVRVGDVAAYRNPKTDAVVHVGTVITHEVLGGSGEYITKVLSQFGRDGEYVHSANILPKFLVLSESNPVLEFWSERV